MSALEITYDSRQDRVLLKTGLDVTQPDWWITRRIAKSILVQLGASVQAQIETQQLIERLTHADDSQDVGVSEAVNDAEKRAVENSQTRLSRNNECISQVDTYPLAIKHVLEVQSSEMTRLSLIQENGTGIAMDLPQAGVIRIKQMFMQLFEQAHW